MTTQGFQVFKDRFGNLTVSAGMVVQPRTGARVMVGGGSFSEIARDRSAPVYESAAPLPGGIFVGGSGRNLVSTGIVVGLSSGDSPVGFWRPAGAGFRLGGFLLDPATGQISDGTDIVAEWTTGTLPEGDYTATTYGETTYNDGDPFTLTVTAEGGDVGIPSATVTISDGLAQAGGYTATSPDTWESDDDPDWTVTINADGTADLKYLTDIIASRAAGALDDPSGFYESTTLGNAYNLTDAEPVDGEPWRATVRLESKPTRVGYAYLEITEDGSATLDTVAGPFFASSIPAPAGTVFYFELAYSDGYTVTQTHSGAVVWP